MLLVVFYFFGIWLGNLALWGTLIKLRTDKWKKKVKQNVCVTVPYHAGKRNLFWKPFAIQMCKNSNLLDGIWIKLPCLLNKTVKKYLYF